MRRLSWILLWCSLGLPGISAPQDREAELRRRVEEALRGELERSRASVLDLVRRELGGLRAPSAGGIAEASRRLSEEHLRRHLEALADDAMEGRHAGYPGADRAAEYIARIMAGAGLRPAGEDGGYFQRFSVFRRAARNVLGLLEGADPALRGEIVVVGAHYDHLGTVEQGNPARLGGARGDDRIYNGADDNASGVSVVLALAEALGGSGGRTRRTVLFAAFSGEEEGLFGSRHYVNHPVAPMAQHVLMINLDMVGRNPDRPVEIHGAGSAEGGILRRAVEAAAARAGLRARIHDEVKLILGDSDHASFRARRVPFVFFFSGFHADYHRVTDHADRIAYGNLLRVARAALYLLGEVAEADARPRFSGSGLADPFRLPDFEYPPRPRRMLGVTVEELGDEACAALGLEPGHGALRVEEVHAGSAAEGAGLQAGDAILGIGGVRLPRAGARDRLREVLAERARPGAEVELLVRRGEETLTLKARWAE